MKQDEMKDQQEVMLDRLEPIKEELTAIPNVLAVGIGLKESNGEFTDEISYRVFVDRKRPLSELSPDEIVPPTINGIKTDVITPYVIKLRPGVCGNERRTLSKHRPLQAGIAISNDSTSYGTLGWFGTLDADDSRVLLTNEHVIGATANAKVAQPKLGSVSTCCCCECGSEDVVGRVLHGIPSGGGSMVDCAIARVDAEFAAGVNLSIANNATTEVITIGDPATAAAVVGDPVRKIGARSGFTQGVVLHIGDAAAAGLDPAGNAVTVIPNQVLVIPDAAETYQVSDQSTGVEICKFAFSNNGDSGSVIVNASDEIVALLYGGDETTNSVDITFANNIANVLNALSTAGFAITLSPSGGGRSDVVPPMRRIREPEPVEVAFTLLESLAQANRQSLIGRLYEKHHLEILELINHRRAVTVAWQRKQGPAYVAALARAARETAFPVPYSINDVSRRDLLVGLRGVLMDHGSFALRSDLELYGDRLLDAAIHGDSIYALADNLKRDELIDVLPSGSLRELA